MIHINEIYESIVFYAILVPIMAFFSIIVIPFIILEKLVEKGHINEIQDLLFRAIIIMIYLYASSIMIINFIGN